MSEGGAKVHVVDDDPAAGDACRFMLEGYGYDVAYWSEPEAFLAQAQLTGCGVVVLDMRMPGLDGAKVHRILRRRDSSLAVVLLTAHGDVPMAVEAMKHGAVDFLQKPARGADLAAAVEAALEVSRRRRERAELRARLERLSPREREVAEAVARGLTNREIAEELHLAARTVEVHRASAVRKLGAQRGTELAALWQRLRDLEERG